MERCLGLTKAPLALSTVCAYGPYTCSLRDDSWNLTLIRWLPMRRFPYLCRSASIRLLHRICFRSPGNPYKYIFRICGCIYWSHTLSRFVFRHKEHQGPCERNRDIQTLKVGWNGLSWWKRAHRWYLLVGPFVGGERFYLQVEKVAESLALGGGRFMFFQWARNDHAAAGKWKSSGNEPALCPLKYSTSDAWNRAQYIVQ